jgi:hypothetical protein
LYTSKPVAGDVMVTTSVVEIKLTRGINNPLFADDTSNIADALAAAPVLLIARL